MASCPAPEGGEENNTKQPAEEPNPTTVQDAGVKEPPSLLEKETFPEGVEPERLVSATVAVHRADAPCSTVEGVQFTFTTIPRRDVES